MADSTGWWLRPVPGALITAVALAALTVILAPLVEETLLPVALAYVLIALLAAALWGWVVGLAAALASNLLFNFFFVEPLHRILVSRPQDVAGLVMFLAVTAIGAGMLSLLRRQLRVAQAARAESKALLHVSREVAQGVTARDALDRLCSAIASTLGVQSCGIVAGDGELRVLATSSGLSALSREESNLVRTALQSGDTVFYDRRQGAPTRSGRRVPGAARVSFIPVRRGPGAPSVIRIAGEPHAPEGASLGRLMEAFKDEVSVAVHRAELQEETRAMDELKRADELKSALLSSLSHDLRTPLTAVKAAVGNLRDESLDWSAEDRQALLETIEEQTDRLSTTVTGLLEMSRLEAGVVKPQLEVIQAAPLMEEVVEANRIPLDGRPVTVCADPSVWLRADYRLLFQALGNLIENAAKHSEQGGAIELGAQSTDGHARLWIRDSGPGPDPAELEHVFEKFYRGKASRRDGSGLGLAIVKAMVELNGGTVDAERVDGGTRFAINLSAVPAPK